MTIHPLSCLAACALIVGTIGCDKITSSTKPSPTREEKAKNIGDQYVRGVLGTGNNAKGTIGVAAITKAIQMYQVEKGANPPSLTALHARSTAAGEDPREVGAHGLACPSLLDRARRARHVGALSCGPL